MNGYPCCGVRHWRSSSSCCAYHPQDEPPGYVTVPLSYFHAFTDTATDTRVAEAEVVMVMVVEC